MSYIGHTYSQPGNMIKSISQGRKVDILPVLMPIYQDETGTNAKIKRARDINRTLDLEYDEGIKERNRKIQTLDENVEAAYSLVWGQCTASMQAQIKTMANYTTIRDGFLMFDLLKEIKGTLLNSLIVITPINQHGIVTTLCLILNKEKESFWTSSRSNSMLSLKQQKVTAAALG